MNFNWKSDAPLIAPITLGSLKASTIFMESIRGFNPDYKVKSEAELKDFSAEESLRLFYVAITRAKENLYLLYSKKRMVWGDIKMYPPSRFIAEIPDKYLTKNVSTPIVNTQEGYHKSGITRVIEKRAKDSDSTFQKDPKGSLLSSIQRIKNQNKTQSTTTVVRTQKRVEVVKKNREEVNKATAAVQSSQVSSAKPQEKVSVSDLIIFKTFFYYKYTISRSRLQLQSGEFSEKKKLPLEILFCQE